MSVHNNSNGTAKGHMAAQAENDTAETRTPKRERGMNKIFLLGRLGRDPEGKYTPDGTLVVTASLGVNTYPNSPTDWFNLVFWRNTGELALQLLEKGARVQIEGHVRVKPYIDARTNERKIAHQVEVIEFVIVDYPNSSGRNGNGASGSRQAGAGPEVEEVDASLAAVAAELNDLPL